MQGLLEVDVLRKYFPVRSGLFRKTTQFVHAVDGVSFAVQRGETLALVGESGCGKTTLAKLILRFIEPDEGSVRLMEHDLLRTDAEELRKLRAKMQMIFQDPLASLNPRRTVGQILSQPFTIHGDASAKQEARSRAAALLVQIGLSPPEVFIDRYPHELSGGQRQRIVIARAVALAPSFVVADEPVSALDLSVRAQILDLMKNLQKEYNLTYLFITHDLAVVRSMANRVAIMYFGKIVEEGTVEQIFRSPLHPYTLALLSATPIPNPRKARERNRMILTGEVPSTTDVPTGCRFHPRCPFKRDICVESEPEMRTIEQNHAVSCHFAEEIRKESSRIVEVV